MDQQGSGKRGTGHLHEARGQWKNKSKNGKQVEMGKEKAAKMLYTMGELQYMVKKKWLCILKWKKQAWELIIKKNLEILRGGRGQEHTPPHQNLCYPGVNFMEINLTFSSTLPPTGTISATTRWKPPHFKQAPSNSHAHSSLITIMVSQESKVRSYNVWNPDL